MRKILLILASFVALTASAYDAVIDGIYYDFDAETQTATVTYLAKYKSTNAKAYVGDITIPETVMVGDVEYMVTAVRDGAFYQCASLTSVLFPNTITSIGASAFDGCSELKSVNIPSGVTEIPKFTFIRCPKLESVEFSEGLLSIGISAFAYATALRNLNLPNSLTTISSCAFIGCGVVNLVLPDELSQMDDRAFLECPNLKTLVIGDKLAELQVEAFSNCPCLESVTLGRSVKSISSNVFSNAPKLNVVMCMGNQTISANSNAFTDCGNYALYVNNDIVEKFVAWSPWKKFANVLPLQCAQPTISWENNSFVFQTETNLKHAETFSESFVYSINVLDATREVETDEATVPMSCSYAVQVYSKIPGSKSANSEVRTAQLSWVNREYAMEKDLTGIEDAPLRPVLINSKHGAISVNGLDEGEIVRFYSIDGRFLGTSRVLNGAAQFQSAPGQVVIARFGDQSLRVHVNP